MTSSSFYLDEIVQTACQISTPGGNRRLHSSSSSEEGSTSDDVGVPSRKWTPPYLRRGQKPRPQVTLRYMQSLDGSLTVPEKSHLPDVQEVSVGEVCRSVQCAVDSVVSFVGRLRANHDVILIGGNTIERDDPSLLSGHSRQPRPVVLDTDLKFPVPSKLLEYAPDRKPWIFCRRGLETDPRKAELEGLGCRVFHASVDEATGFLDLEEVLRALYEDLDIQKVVVEGGVRVLENFIRSQLFDKIVVIMAPCFGVGRALFQQEPDSEALRAGLPKLTNIRYDVLGMDLVMSAEPLYEGNYEQLGESETRSRGKATCQHHRISTLSMQ